MNIAPRYSARAGYAIYLGSRSGVRSSMYFVNVYNTDEYYIEKIAGSNDSYLMSPVNGTKYSLVGVGLTTGITALTVDAVNSIRNGNVYLTYE